MFLLIQIFLKIILLQFLNKHQNCYLTIPQLTLPNNTYVPSSLFLSPVTFNEIINTCACISNSLVIRYDGIVSLLIIIIIIIIIINFIKIQRKGGEYCNRQ